jgi:hypothetical protein
MERETEETKISTMEKSSKALRKFSCHSTKVESASEARRAVAAPLTLPSDNKDKSDKDRAGVADGRRNTEQPSADPAKGPCRL